MWHCSSGSVLETQAAFKLKTLVGIPCYQNTWHHTSEDCNINTHCHKNFQISFNIHLFNTYNMYYILYLCVWLTDVRKVMADAPEWVSLELAHHFLKLAIAAYTWPFVMYRYPFSGLTKLAANMTCCSCLRWVSPGTSMLMLGACCSLSLYRTVGALTSCTFPELLFFSKYFFALLHMAPYCCWVNQDNIPSVVIRLWTGWCGVRFPVATTDFPLRKMCRPTLRATQSPIRWVPGTL